MLESVHIAANKNTVPGDVSAMVPGGIRMGKAFSLIRKFLFDFCGVFKPDKFLCASGTPALTSRGFVEEDFAKVAEFFDSAVKLALKIKTETQGAYIFDICNFLVIGSIFFYMGKAHLLKSANTG